MLGPNQLPVNDEVNIHEVLERVRNLVAAEFGSSVAIEQDYDPSIPPLRGDADQLVQAVLNIVRNALEALENQMTNTFGVITLRSRVQRQCTIGPKRHKLVARVDIIDNGPGIPEEKLEEIFYPLITGRAEGTGLGLSIAQVLVNQHNGLVECESRPGNTVFTILLPLEKNDGK
jgi:two-component system nitrogen regulation sensor histidine kinase GlnL